MFTNKTLLITGGTGSFGQACASYLLKKCYFGLKVQDLVMEYGQKFGIKM